MSLVKLKAEIENLSFEDICVLKSLGQNEERDKSIFIWTDCLKESGLSFVEAMENKRFKVAPAVFRIMYECFQKIYLSAYVVDGYHQIHRDELVNLKLFKKKDIFFSIYEKVVNSTKSILSNNEKFAFSNDSILKQLASAINLNSDTLKDIYAISSEYSHANSTKLHINEGMSFHDKLPALGLKLILVLKRGPNGG